MVAEILGLRIRSTWRSLNKHQTASSGSALLLVALILPLFWASARLGWMAGANYGQDGLRWALGVTQLGLVASAAISSRRIQAITPAIGLRYPIKAFTLFWANVIGTLTAVRAWTALVFMGAALVGFGQRVSVTLNLAAVLATLGLFVCSITLVQVIALLAGHPSRLVRVMLPLGLATCAFSPVIWLQTTLKRGEVVGLRRALRDIDEAWSLLPTTAPFTRSEDAALAADWISSSIALATGVLLIGVLSSYGAALTGRAASVWPSVKSRERPSPLHYISGTRVATALLAKEFKHMSRAPRIFQGIIAVGVVTYVALGEVPIEYVPLAATLGIAILGLVVLPNQFGLDRGGIRLLLRLPVDPQTVLLVKNVVAALSLAIGLVVSVIAASFRSHLDGEALVVMISVGLGLLPIAVAVGNWCSVSWPWRANFKLGPQMEGGTPLIGEVSILAVCVAYASLLIGIARHLHRVDARFFLAGSAVMLSFGLPVWWIALRASARRLRDRSEEIVSAVGGAPHGMA